MTHKAFPWYILCCVGALVGIPTASAAPALAIHRVGSFAPPGDLVQFDTNDPGGGTLLGNIGLGNVGTMDVFDGVPWVVSGDGGSLSFYTLDPQTASVSFQSSFDGAFGGTSVFSGSFDADGDYWVADLVFNALHEFDPHTGTSLSTVPLAANAGPNGIAFVDDVLYAVHGGFGDPLQEFGTIDTATGAFTFIGLTGVGIGGLGGGNGTGALDYDPVTNTMYLVYRAGIEPGQFWSLYTVDINSGAASFVGEIQPERNYDAFTIIPEPSALVLVSIGSMWLGGRKRRRRTRSPVAANDV